jgi:xanthine/CO dehydrogenase XdhC/CoxF family maturation factor
MAADTVGKLVCPIGLTTIKDKAPAAIAASVAAQVLTAREAVATPIRTAAPSDLPLSGGGKGARHG